MPLPILPTALVGSYAQPEWLIDRAKLAGRFPPRVRAKELRRVEPALLGRAQGRRDPARDPRPGARRAGPAHSHGADRRRDTAFVSRRAAGRRRSAPSGEIRRESYSNHFATALEGVDVDNPGTALDRSGHPNPVPRIVGPIHRPHPVQVRDLEFLRSHTDRPVGSPP